MSVINFNDKRHKRYKKYWDMYRNKPFYRKYDENYISVALPQEVAKLYRDLAFSKDITPYIKDNPEANKAIDRLIFENDLNSMLSEAAITCAVKGGVILKNYLSNNRSKITFILPDYYFPEMNPYNQRETIRETIAFPITEGDETFLYQEIYEQRDDGYYWCITKKSHYQNDEIGVDVESEEVNTGLTESPLTYVPFSRHNGDTFGYSLYFGLEPIFEKFNHFLSQIGKILSKHSAPNIIASEDLLDENYKWTTSEHGLVIPYREGAPKPEYMEYNGELKANFEALQELMKLLQYLSPLSASLYGQNKESANSSALSIKLKAFRTAQVIENSLKYWATAIKKVLYIAQQLDIMAGNGSYEPELPRLELKSALPEDSFSLAQEEQLRLASGNTSIKSSISRLSPHLTSQEVEEEFLEIINEQNQINSMTFTDSNRSLLNE